MKFNDTLIEKLVGGAANEHCVMCIPKKYDAYFDFAIGIASTTHRDLHGQRMSRQSLDAAVEAIKANYIPYRYDHRVDIPPVGAIVSARTFDLPDGERALGVVVVFYTNFGSRVSFKAGHKNLNFDDYAHLVNIPELVLEHDLRVLELSKHTNQAMLPVEALNAFMASHTILDDGSLFVTKHRVLTVYNYSIEVYPKDHRPAHFHVISKKKNSNARFRLDNFKQYQMKQGTMSNKECELITVFFKSNPEYAEMLRNEAVRLEAADN
ncbi:MAG: DUF4160 domain-containing protein [Alcaligenaceae bacterium]|nr:MAG: DUF4160 domain-containing protein [Alcaligenaceae bacterium]